MPGGDVAFSTHDDRSAEPQPSTGASARQALTRGVPFEALVETDLAKRDWGDVCTLIVLAGSIAPETADGILRFVREGGRVVITGSSRPTTIWPTLHAPVARQIMRPCG